VLISELLEILVRFASLCIVGLLNFVWDYAALLEGVGERSKRSLIETIRRFFLSLFHMGELVEFPEGGKASLVAEVG